MRALIVDDEQHVIDAILLLVPWKELGIEEVLTACTVEDANRLLESYKPQIVLVDVVIGDHLGSEILQKIRDYGLQSKSIVISGHDDYQYIRAMFVLGAQDYLLKPIEQEALLTAVKSMISKVENETAKPEDAKLPPADTRQQDPYHQQRLCRNLLQVITYDTAYAEFCGQNAVARQASQCMVLFCDGHFLPIGDDAGAKRLHDFLNRLQLLLSEAECGLLYQEPRPTSSVSILLYGDFSHGLSILTDACRTFNRSCTVPLRWGCSRPYAFPQDIAAAWKQAQLASGAIPCNTASIVHPAENDISEPRVPIDIQLENRLFSALLIDSEQQLDTVLNHWLTFVSAHSDPSRGGLKSIWEYFFFLYEKWNRYFASRYPSFSCVPVPPARSFAAIYQENPEATLHAMQRVFHNSLWQMHLSKNKVPDSKGIMQKIADYLELNYNSEFHQSEYSELFHMNKDYMCRKFKETYGVGMVTYVNQIRIRKAKELLVDSDLKVQQIANAVGFFDNKYFSKQFKKETGKSPAEYRLLHGADAQTWKPD